jgi:hypothetical protein
MYKKGSKEGGNIYIHKLNGDILLSSIFEFELKNFFEPFEERDYHKFIFNQP